MDRESLFRQLEKRYISRRELISRVPLGVQPDAVWEELLSRRRACGTVLPLYGHSGAPLWYVTTDRMIAASEKIVGTLLENDTELDLYADPPAVSTLEEVFYTGYVEGAQITMKDAMDFLASGEPPRDIEEQIIANNRAAGNFASANLYRPIDGTLLHEIAGILTDGMDNGGQEYRADEPADYASVNGEKYSFPPAHVIPERVDRLSVFLASPGVHPLIKAGAAQAYMLMLRPFPEGNERLGRLLSNIILLRAGYTCFSDVSLSALIARKSYGYYEAAANTLRPENGGDLTYFLEYCLELLARAVDERRLRAERLTEQNRLSEMELAKTPLAPPPKPSDDPPPSTGSNNDQSARSDSTKGSIAAARQDPTGIHDMSGFSSVSLAELAARETKVACIEDSVSILNDYAKAGDKPIGRLAAYVLRLMDAGRSVFSTEDLQTELGFTSWNMSTSLRPLKRCGILSYEKTYNGYKYYRIYSGAEPEQPETVSPPNDAPTPPDAPPGDPSLLEKINELSQSKSQKDRRIASMLTHCMDKGEITIEDYGEIGEFTKLTPDMEFAQQLGLVRKVSNKCYRILRTPSTDPPLLTRQQRRIFTEIYEVFGEKVFSTEMVIANLDYSGSSISAYLHQFTLLRLLDCRKEDVYWYQFLVNPTENPEMFDLAS